MKNLYSKFNSSIILIILILVFFLPKLINGKIPIPADTLIGLYHPFRDLQLDGYNEQKFPTKNPLITDPVLQTYPWRNLVIDNLKNFNLPLWNPYNFSGQPLLANIQSAVFQITNILFFIFPMKIAWAFQIIAPLILGALFMFFFLKEIKLSVTSSFFGAAIYPFTGFFVAWQQWGTVISTAIWLPLILLSILKLIQKINIFWFLALVFSISQTIFSGHFQTSFYTLIFTCIFTFYLFIKQKQLKNIYIITIGIICGLVISSIQLIPALEFIQNSSRNIDQGYFLGREDWFIPLKQLVQFIAPDFFGNPTTYNYWGIWNYAEFVGFIGITPLLLAIIGLFSTSKYKNFFIFTALFSILLALENPVSKLIFILNIPLISTMQPSRIIYILIFSLCILAAFGLEKIFLNKKLLIQSYSLLLFIIICLILYIPLFGLQFQNSEIPNPDNIALRNLFIPLFTLILLLIPIGLIFLKFNKKIILSFLIFISIIELFRFGYKFLPFSKLNWIFPSTTTINLLQNQPKPFRIMATDRRILHPNINSVYKIESISGYDPLYFKDYAKFISSLEASKIENNGSFNRIITPQNYNSKLINLLNVKFILSFDEIKNENLIKIHQEGKTILYENKNVIPRAFFVNEIIKTNSKDDELKNLFENDINFNTTAYSNELEFKKTDLNSQIKFINYSDQLIKIKTNLNTQAPLVITNINYPGWQAKIDNNLATINSVNYLFQSIVVPEGEHEIKLLFKPKSFYNGLLLTLSGFVLSLIVSIYIWKNKSQ